MKIAVIGLPEARTGFFQSLPRAVGSDTMGTLGQRFHIIGESNHFIEYSAADRFHLISKRDLQHADLVLLVSSPSEIEGSPQQVYLDHARDLGKRIIDCTDPLTGRLVSTPEEFCNVQPSPALPEDDSPTPPQGESLLAPDTADLWAVSTPFNARRHQRAEKIAEKMREDAFNNEAGL